MAQGKSSIKSKKHKQSGGSVKKQLGKTKKGLKKQVKARKADQIVSKSVSFPLSIFVLLFLLINYICYFLRCKGFFCKFRPNPMVYTT